MREFPHHCFIPQIPAMAGAQSGQSRRCETLLVFQGSAGTLALALWSAAAFPGTLAEAALETVQLLLQNASPSFNASTFVIVCEGSSRQ